MQLTNRHNARVPRAPAGPLRKALAAAGIIVFAAIQPSLVLAQSSTQSQAAGEPGGKRLNDFVTRRDKAREDLESSRKYLEENRQRAGTIEEELQRLSAERAALNNDLITTSEKIKNTEAKMTTIEGRLGKLEQQEGTLRESLNGRHKSISRLLAAIQRMGRNPPPVMITRRSDALAMVRSAMLLARAFPQLSGEAMVLAKELNTLVALMNGIRQESDQLRTEAETLREDQTRLATLMRTKRQSLGDRQVELAEVRRTVQIIGGNVKSLEDLITKLEPAIAKETRIGREIEAATRKSAIAEAEAAARSHGAARAEQERKLRELQLALNVPKPPVPTGKPGNPVEPAVVRPPPSDGIINPAPSIDLSPEQGGAYIGDNARLTPAVPFQLAKGKLPMPAAGELETQFGEPTEYGGRSKGLVIKTRYGAQITSPTDGWVVYAGKFRTYGQLLIIKAGDGYHVLLAGLSRIDVQAGQFVLAAEPVGTMKPAPGVRSGKNSPRLYVEFRKDGRPINPRPWWSASSKQKVQG